ncbi:MAG: hypothetical protein H6977_07275 [Gammaproteobacteria bacterium]|nr:hypothetical protein [Gammaproteobacteria bacterium]
MTMMDFTRGAGRARHAMAGFVLALAMPAATAPVDAAVTPDFSAYVEVASEAVAPGKVAGTIRNISSGPLRNVVLRVRHAWRWPGLDGARGGSEVETRRVVLGELVLPGEFAGFASVHEPGARVPARASYSYEVTVLELTTVGLAP